MNPTHDKRDPNRIENDIEHTRSRIETNLDKLSAQFTPSNLVERALGTNPETGEGDSFGVMLERAKANPLGAALIAAGVATMAMRRNEPRRARAVADARVDDYPVEPYSNDPAERIAHNISALETQADSLRDDVSATAASLKDSVTSAVDSITDTAGNVVDKVTGTVKRGTQSASHAYDSSRDHSQSAARYVRTAPRRARNGAEYLADWIAENPLPSGLFALAVGAAVATAVTASNADEPRRQSRDFDDDYDRDAAARATRAAALATSRTRREHAPMPVPTPVTPPKPATTKAATSSGVSSATTSTGKPSISKASPAPKPAGSPGDAGSSTAAKSPSIESQKTDASAGSAAKPSAPKKTAPLLKTAPDTGSDSIVASKDAPTKPKT